VDWGELDYLVVDLPPGTGDVQLTLIQTAPITGAIVVTTPSDVSLEDARKAVHMFRQVRVEVLGIVENMSYLICPHCAQRVDVFSYGGGQRTAAQMGVPFLGEVAARSGSAHRRRYGRLGGSPLARRPARGRLLRPRAQHASPHRRDRRAPGPSIEVAD